MEEYFSQEKTQSDQLGLAFAKIPLQHVSFKAQVDGLFARVECKQIYECLCTEPIEAVYVFPLPPEAAVIGCTMKIGEHVVMAQLKERTQAREVYEQAVEKGHHAQLLEQQRPNIFTMSVGNIPPGKLIEAEVTYVQRVPWQQSGGRLTIPTVVAPRFIPGKPTGKSAGGWANDTDEVPDASKITPEVSKLGVPYKVNIGVALRPGFLCQVSSPSHPQLVSEMRLQANDPQIYTLFGLAPDRDFVLCYSSDSTQVQVSVHRSMFGSEEFAVVAVVPPNQETASRPRNIIFCLDVSGSMSGAKIAGLKVIAGKILKKIVEETPSDQVGIVAFHEETEVVKPLGVIDERTYEAIHGLNARGGTQALLALNKCFKLFPVGDERENSILFVTDGQTEDHDAQRPLAPRSGGRIMGVGIDTAVNLDYIQKVTEQTGGAHIACFPGEDFNRVATTLRGMLSGPVLKGLSIQGDGCAEVPETVGLRDVFVDMPATLAMRAGRLPGKVYLTGKDAFGNEVVIPIDLKKALPTETSHILWAREAIRVEPDDERRLMLSLKYGVLSSATAFVSIHEVVEQPGQNPKQVEIPVMLPATWEYDKVFGNQKVPMFPSINFLAISGAPTRCRGVLRRPRGGAIGEERESEPRASLEAQMLAWKFRELASAVEHDAIDLLNAKKILSKLTAELLQMAVSNHNSITRAIVFLALRKLECANFTVDQDALNLVSGKPHDSEDEALKLWNEAQNI